DGTRFTADTTKGLEDFSHLEVVFRFHLTDPTDLNLGACRPRDNPDWPEVGIFGHRNMRRINWLGISGAGMTGMVISIPPERRPGHVWPCQPEVAPEFSSGLAPLGGLERGRVLL
ncbi:MAG TPA: hypothetical protein VF062_22495, partial [Candidatus Limnocylindrales bacterium]